MGARAVQSVCDRRVPAHHFLGSFFYLLGTQDPSKAYDERKTSKVITKMIRSGSGAVPNDFSCSKHMLTLRRDGMLWMRKHNTKEVAR